MRSSATTKGFILALLFLCIVSCRHTPVISQNSVHFDEGVCALAHDLADQLDQASIGNMFKKTVGEVFSKVNDSGNPLQLKKITIDPFIDAESGYPLKANAAITKLVGEELQGRYQVTGEMDPGNLEGSQYVLSGLVTCRKEMGKPDGYTVFATVVEKDSGDVLAAASVSIDRFDTTPLNIYLDSPVFLKGKNYQDLLLLVRKEPGSSTTRRYSKRLQSKALLVRADLFYEKQNYQKSLADYRELAGRLDEPELEALNGEFTNLVKQGHLEEAEKVYAKLLRAGIAQSDPISHKIFFAPNTALPLETGRGLYKMYLRQMARLVAAAPDCRVQIVGHCGRSGSESFNEKLSLQRAEWVSDEMAAVDPAVRGRLQTIGRGFRENLVGTGKDDLTDAIDRRVDFSFIQCAPPDSPPPSPGGDREDGGKTTADNRLYVEDIEFYLRNKVSSKVIASRIAERGVRFKLTDQIGARLRKSKADSRIFKAIEEANAGKERGDP